MSFSIVVTFRVCCNTDLQSMDGICFHALPSLCTPEVKYVDGATDDQMKAISEAAKAEFNKGKPLADVKYFIENARKTLELCVSSEKSTAR